jgi:hypothetical protein
LHALANPLTRNIILDWQPFASALASQWQLNPAASGGYICAIAIVAAFVGAIVLGRATDDLALIAVASLMTVSAAVSVRNLPLALITIATPFTHHLALALKTRTAANAIARTPVPKPHLRGWWIGQGMLCTFALALLAATGMFSKRLRSDKSYPFGAVRFMKLHGLHGNILDTFDWGEYLIWHLPGSKIFVDGRYDTVYPARVLNDMVAFNFNQPEVAQVIGGDPHDYELLPGDVPADRLMRSRADWKLAYRDEYIRLYVRPGSAAAENHGVRVVIKQPGAAQILVGYSHDFVLLRADAPANQLMEARADWKLVYRDEYSRLYARAASAIARIPSSPIIGKAQETDFPW